MIVQDAKIVTNRGVREWRCPNCGQKLAEIIGGRVVIKVADRLISIATSIEHDQVCWRCGATSVLDLLSKEATRAVT